MRPNVKTLLNDLFSVEMLLYMLFGAMTAAIDIFTAYYLYDMLKSGVLVHPPYDVVTANTISFLLSVTFSFFTNKIFVFKSKSETRRQLRIEAAKFFIARLMTFGLSLVALVVCVNVFMIEHDLSKLMITVVVVILNYIFSKLIFFSPDEGDALCGPKK